MCVYFSDVEWIHHGGQSCGIPPARWQFTHTGNAVVKSPLRCWRPFKNTSLDRRPGCGRDTPVTPSAVPASNPGPAGLIPRVQLHWEDTRPSTETFTVGFCGMIVLKLYLTSMDIILADVLLLSRCYRILWRPNNVVSWVDHETMGPWANKSDTICVGAWHTDFIVVQLWFSFFFVW